MADERLDEESIAYVVEVTRIRRHITKVKNWVKVRDDGDKMYDYVVTEATREDQDTIYQYRVEGEVSVWPIIEGVRLAEENRAKALLTIVAQGP